MLILQETEGEKEASTNGRKHLRSYNITGEPERFAHFTHGRTDAVVFKREHKSKSKSKYQQRQQSLNYGNSEHQHPCQPLGLSSLDECVFVCSTPRCRD
jgi:hypothetical protein